MHEHLVILASSPPDAPAASPGGSWTLLILFAIIALGTSFLCSLSEAAILSMSRAFTSRRAKEGGLTGRLLDAMKSSIEKPLNAILTLNTVANTVGAIGVGAQAGALFDDVWVGVASGIMTYLVLILGELIPKKLGAVYCEPIAPLVAYVIAFMQVVTVPLIVFAKPVTWVADRIMLRIGGGAPATVSRETVHTIAELGLAEGTLRGSESAIIQNLLKLNTVRVHEVMTPRTVVFMLSERTTVLEAMKHERFTQHTRIPIYRKGIDDITGVVIKGNLYEAFTRGEGRRRLSSFRRRLRPIPEQATLLHVLDEFAHLGHHIFLVVDEFGGTAGVVTLEDVLESIIGQEIVDETDEVADLREAVTNDADASEVDATNPPTTSPT